MDCRKREILKSLAKVAWADGQVTAQERALLFSTCLQLGASEIEVAELEEVLGESKTSTEQAQDLKSVLPDKASRLNVMRALLTMSMVDGVMAFAEFELIESTCKQLEITPEEMETLRKEAISAASSFQRN